jgi:hypothetical protein
MILYHDTEKYRGVSNPPFTKTMNKTVTQQTKEFYRNWRRTVRWTLPNYLRPSSFGERTGTFYFKDAWRTCEDAGTAHLKRPLNLWADAHTISVADDIITITRDENNQVSTYTYGEDIFNTICVKNIDEARKIENNQAHFGGLYVVDYTTRNVYRLVVKKNKKVRLERVLNTWVTKLPWLTGSTQFKNYRSGQRIETAFGGVLNTTNTQPSNNGY